MTIRFKCTHCQKPLSVKDHLAGKKAACPVCKKAIAIPVPVSAPADVDAFAAEAFADKPVEKPAEVSSKPIEYTCPFCDEELQLAAELGGKKVPCPKCTRIIKVPEVKVAKPKDWRTTQKGGPSAAMANLPEQLSDAWGTEQKGRVSREAMEEAGAIPEPAAKPIGVGGWIRRGFWICLLGGIGVLVFSMVMRSQHSRREKYSLEQAKTYLPKLEPLLQAEYYRTEGEIAVRNLNADAARDSFVNARTMAQSSSREKVSSLEHDLFLNRLVLGQAEMGGSGDEILKRSGAQHRFDWNEGTVQQEMLRTLEAMRSVEGKAAALRDLTSKFQLNGKLEIAMFLAANLANSSGGQRSPFMALQKAILLTRKEAVPDLPKGDGKENEGISAPDLSKDLTDTLSRLAYSQGYALSGNYAEAFKIASAKGPASGRLEACVAAAAIALTNKEAKEAQRFLDEGLKAYEKLIQDKTEKIADWPVTELIRLCSRTDTASNSKALLEQLPAHLRPQAQLDIFEGQLEKNPTKSVDNARVEEVGEPVRPFAWEAFARHNSRLGGGGSIRIDDFDELYRPFLHLGIALGEQDRKK